MHAVSDDNLERDYRALLDALAKEGVRIVSKADAWHQRAIGRLLALVTFGRARTYVSDFCTTLGSTIYVTPDWESRALGDRYETLRHERVHVQQFRRYGRVPMAVAYLLLPLPVGLAWCRMRLEREAYAETVRVTYALGGRLAVERIRAHVLAQFSSANYGWMWPFAKPMRRWYDALVRELDGDSG